jgi:hypothetical protein
MTDETISHRYRVYSITVKTGSTYNHRIAELGCIPDGSHWATRPQSIKWPMSPDCNWKPDDVIEVRAILQREGEP